jgi:hypothetical protein
MPIIHCPLCGRDLEVTEQQLEDANIGDFICETCDNIWRDRMAAIAPGEKIRPRRKAVREYDLNPARLSKRWEPDVRPRGPEKTFDVDHPAMRPATPPAGPVGNPNAAEGGETT